MLVRVLLPLGCVLLASCDQFARVGTLDSRADVMPPDPPADGGQPTERDAALAPADGGKDGGHDAGASCPPLIPTGCDPVTNQGCPGALGMFCAIDYAATLTGYCIFSAPPGPLMPTECLNTGVTESCPARFTCFADRCSRICLCDADCDPGQCCTQPIEATGFSVCVEC